MPQVPGAPYEPYPTVAPAERVLRPGGVPEVPNAFGVGVANAISNFGGDVEKAGSAVFNSALELRKQQIETGVRDEVTQHYQNVAPAQAAFMAAQGNNASQEVLTQRMADIGAATKAARDRVVAKYGIYGGTLFDADTAAMTRNWMNQATLHSAQQVKVAAHDSINARAKTIDDSVQSDPGNSAAYVQGLKDRIGLEVERGRLLGLDDNTVASNIADARSNLTHKRIIGTAIRGDDAGAQAQLDQAIEDKTLRGDVADKTQEQIRIQAHRNLTYATAVDAEQRRAENESLMKDVAGIRARNVTVDDNGNEVINPNFLRDAVALTQTHPNAENVERVSRTLSEWYTAKQAKPPPVVRNGEVADRLNARLFDRDNPLTDIDIDQAELDGMRGRPGIDNKFAGVLRNMVKNKATLLKDPAVEDTVKAVKNRLELEGLQRGDLQWGDDAFARFAQNFYEPYVALVGAGRGMARGALNMEDQDSLVSVALNAARAGGSMQDRMRRTVMPDILAPTTGALAEAPITTAAPTGPPQMRRPGETFADWLVRTKGTPEPAPPISR